MFLEDGVQLDERCCFGDASAATKCARISNLAAWRVRRAFQAVDAQCHQWPMRDNEREGVARVACRERGERGVRGVSGEHAWVGMFVDDLVCAAADDDLLSVGGTPR